MKRLPPMNARSPLSQITAGARMNLGYMYFKKGDLLRGFEGYEGRWKIDDFVDPWPNYPQPVWDGSDLGGRTVLLWYEQGFGDTIQFVRYASLVPIRNGKAIVLCQPQLKRLLKQLKLRESKSSPKANGRSNLICIFPDEPSAVFKRRGRRCHFEKVI